MKCKRLVCAYRHLWSNYQSFREKFPSFLQFWWTKMFGNIDFRDFYSTQSIGRELTGYSIIRKHKKCNEVTIEYLHILPPFRRNGYARDAVIMFMQIYETEGFNRMNVVLDADNLVGRALFVNLDFEIDWSETNKLQLQGMYDTEKLVMFMTLR